jgi:ATP-dependent 26S proteasome regulatory subunit
MALTFEEAFETYLKSAFPIMLVPTPEVDRATKEIAKRTKEWSAKLMSMKLPVNKSHLKMNGYVCYKWDCINGWRDYENPDTKIENTAKQPHEGLRWLISGNAPAGVYVMENAHMFFGDTYTLPELVQFFREHYELGKLSNRHLFLVGDYGDLPPELQTLCVVMEFPLPKREELVKFVGDYAKGLGMDVKPKVIEDAADAATGMTTHEVESAVCVAAVTSKGKNIDRNIVFEEKAKAVKRSGLLEHMKVDTSMAQIGGLNNFKNWLGKVGSAFQNLEAARKYGLPMPKGCLVAGISGTGKSACAKATAGLFDVPLFRLDIGRVFGGLVGETERKTRQLIQLMEAVSPCVILIDEIEKALAGLSSSDATDSGVTARLMGNLLYWLQEKTAPVYIIATANEVGKLPPEMLRKGRFDELFFVDLPSEDERKEILRIHIEKTGRDIKKFKSWEKLAGKPTTGYTGAEIEAVVKQAMFDAFSDGQREYTVKDIAAAINVTVPLIQTKAKEIEALRAWASNKARSANVGEIVKVSSIPKRTAPSVFIDDEMADGVKALAKRSTRRKADG